MANLFFLLEELPLVRFNYKNFKKDKTPKIQVLDTDYKGIPGQKSYGVDSDVLGFNTNYYSDKKSRKVIDELMKELKNSNNLEKYNSIKKNNPEIVPHIRRYKKRHIKNLRMKKLGLWMPTSWDEVDKKLGKE